MFSLSRVTSSTALLTLPPTIHLSAVVLAVVLGMSAPMGAHAQTSNDHTYNCGSYSAGAFGGADCVSGADVSPPPRATPTPPVAPTLTPTPLSVVGGMNGAFPGTGASLGRWAAIGALLLAIGLGLYGWSRRQARRS